METGDIRECFHSFSQLSQTFELKYRKIPVISPRIIFGGVYYWREFCVSKLVGLDNKNSSKDYENSLKQLSLTVRGLIFERAYYRKDICV